VRVVAITLAALALASAVAGAATGTRLKSGLHGVVMRGPTKPVCEDTEPCEEPAVGVVLQFWQNGRLAAQVKTVRGGRYVVRLRRGRYAVKTLRRYPGTGLTPRAVRVPAARLARVDFHLDTGIQ
jgi:hypothetical protein